MEIYLLRHGIAEPYAASDAERELTDEGRQKVRHVMKVARRAAVAPSLVLSSPYRRALETARIAVEVLDYQGHLLQTETLVPDSDPEAVWDEIRTHRDESSLLLAGHEPLFGTLGAYLLGVPEMRIDFKKGALMAIEMGAFGPKPRGTLKWMLTAKIAT